MASLYWRDKPSIQHYGTYAGSRGAGPGAVQQSSGSFIFIVLWLQFNGSQPDVLTVGVCLERQRQNTPSIHHVTLRYTDQPWYMFSSRSWPGQRVGLDQRSYSKSGPVNTWMSDCLRVGKPYVYVTSHLGQLSLPSLQGRYIKYQPFWLGLGKARSPVSGGR